MFILSNFKLKKKKGLLKPCFPLAMCSCLQKTSSSTSTIQFYTEKTITIFDRFFFSGKKLVRKKYDTAHQFLFFSLFNKILILGNE